MAREHQVARQEDTSQPRPPLITARQPGRSAPILQQRQAPKYRKRECAPQQRRRTGRRPGEAHQHSRTRDARRPGERRGERWPQRIRHADLSVMSLPNMMNGADANGAGLRGTNRLPGPIRAGLRVVSRTSSGMATTATPSPSIETAGPPRKTEARRVPYRCPARARATQRRAQRDPGTARRPGLSPARTAVAPGGNHPGGPTAASPAHLFVTGHAAVQDKCGQAGLGRSSPAAQRACWSCGCGCGCRCEWPIRLLMFARCPQAAEAACGSRTRARILVYEYPVARRYDG